MAITASTERISHSSLSALAGLALRARGAERQRGQRHAVVLRRAALGDAPRLPRAVRRIKSIKDSQGNSDPPAQQSIRAMGLLCGRQSSQRPL